MSREIKPFDPASVYGMGPAPQQQTIDLRRVMAGIRRQRWIILLPALILGFLGLLLAKSAPDTYQAYANLMLDSNMNHQVRQVSGIDTPMADDLIENARVVLGSDKLAYDVLDRTGLQNDPAFMDPPVSRVSVALGQVIGAVLGPVHRLKSRMEAAVAPVEHDAPPIPGEVANPTVAPVDPARRYAAAQLRSGIEVYRLGQSTAVAVSFTGFDPTITAQVANAYADAYVQDVLTSNADSLSRTTAWMQDRLAQLRAQAQAAADTAEKFSTEHNLVGSVSGGLLTGQALNELNASLTEAIGDVARAQAILDTYDQSIAGGVDGLTTGNSLTIGGAVSDELKSRMDSYNDVVARMQRLERTNPRSPQLAGLRQTLATTADRLFVELQSQRQEAASALTVAQARVNALQKSVDEATERNSAQAANLVRLNALQKEAETLSTLYQATLTKSQEIEQQQSFPVSNVRILSYAQVPNGASGPASKRTAVAAGLLGLFFGIAWAALREGRERFLRTSADVTDTSGLRFLGYLPALPKPRRTPRIAAAPKAAAEPVPLAAPTDGDTLPMVVRREVPIIAAPVPVLQFPSSVYAETLRHVRLAAETLNAETRVTGITSFHPYAGRSTVALNLAGQLGLGAESVLLIDADGRGRRLSRMLGLDHKPGLSDALTGRGNWRDMIVGIANTNITVLPCGLAGGGVSDDMLGAKLLEEFLHDAATTFGCVVVDVPPLYPVAQGRAILNILPQFAIVGEWGKTPSAMVDSALVDTPDLEARCLGVVYDRVNMRHLRRYLMPEAMENYLNSSKGYLSLARK